MQDRPNPDHDLAPFFEAAQDKQHQLPEAARRRILLEAEALLPKPKRQSNTTNWSLFNLIKLLPAGAAMASLSLGVFIGIYQPDSISELAGLSFQTEDVGSMFGNGFDGVFDESELNG